MVILLVITSSRHQSSDKMFPNACKLPLIKLDDTHPLSLAHLSSCTIHQIFFCSVDCEELSLMDEK